MSQLNKSQLNNFFKLGFVILFNCLIITGTSFAAERLKPSELPDRVKVSIVKDLSRWLAQVEETVSDGIEKESNKKIIENITIPYEKYLDEKKLSKRQKATLYPWGIYQLLISEIDNKDFSEEEARMMKKKTGELLIEYEKDGKYPQFTQMRQQMLRKTR